MLIACSAASILAGSDAHYDLLSGNRGLLSQPAGTCCKKDQRQYVDKHMTLM